MVKDAERIEGIRQVAKDQANILVVDDRKANRVAMEAILAPLSQNVVLASSGREALRHVLTTEFAVILMDVQMPEMDGLETAKIIRQRDASRYIPIIFITAVNTDDDCMFQGYSVGAVDYITKPFNSSMLASKVGVFVELYHKEKLLKEQTRQLYEKELESLHLMQREREQQLEQEKIRNVNRLLEERVQERTAELEAFCYSISHDLRTPLRSIDGYSALLESELSECADDSIRDSLRRIRLSAQKMDELISALLSLSRITRAEMRPSSISLSELASGIGKELMLNSPERKGVFNVHEEMIANGDAVLIRSLLTNLLSNSWKFTQAREVATIEVGSYLDSAGQTVFFVKDNGIGFNQSYANKLFQPFERLHNSEDYPGSGIGLATVMRIVRKHGGMVWGHGEEGKGAEFFFTL